MSTAHAVTRSVRDSAALLDATHGPDLGAPYYAPEPERAVSGRGHARAGAAADRACRPTTFNGAPTHPECRDAALDAAKLCESLGHHVEPVRLEVDATALARATQVLIALERAGDDRGRRGRARARARLDLVETITFFMVQGARVGDRGRLRARDPHASTPPAARSSASSSATTCCSRRPWPRRRVAIGELALANAPIGRRTSRASRPRDRLHAALQRRRTARDERAARPRLATACRSACSSRRASATRRRCFRLAGSSSRRSRGAIAAPAARGALDSDRGAHALLARGARPGERARQDERRRSRSGCSPATPPASCCATTSCPSAASGFGAVRDPLPEIPARARALRLPQQPARARGARADRRRGRRRARALRPRAGRRRGRHEHLGRGRRGGGDRACASAPAVLAREFDYDAARVRRARGLRGRGRRARAGPPTRSRPPAPRARARSRPRAAWSRSAICDAVISGAADSLCGLTANGFASLGALSERVTNPCSRNRDGLTLGEGAALFLVTRRSRRRSAARRGRVERGAPHLRARPRGATAPRPRCARRSPTPASRPREIAYLNLHGTGTPQNDPMECAAVARVLRRAELPCSSTKPLVGHALGAAGALEAAFCWLVLAERSRRPRSRCRRTSSTASAIPRSAPIHLVGEVARPCRPVPRPRVMTNSFGFGGNNCTLVLGADGRA